MTSCTLVTCYASVTVEIQADDLNLWDLWEQVLGPMLLGAGYHPETIARFLNDEPQSSENNLDDWGF